MALNCLGVIERKEGNYELSRAYLLDAMSFAEDLEDSQLEASTHFELGTTLFRLGAMEVADDHFRESFGGRATPRDRAITVMELASLMTQSGAPHLAISQLHQVLWTPKTALYREEEDRLFDIATFLDHLGTAYLRAGWLDEATNAYSSALEIFPEENPNVPATLGNFGLTFLEACQGRRAQNPEAECPDLCRAEDAFQKSLDLLQLRHEHYRGIFLFRKAQARRLAGDSEKAAEILRESIEHIEGVRTDTRNLFLRRSMFSTHARIYEESINNSMDRYRHELDQGFAIQALLTTERLRARNLFDYKNAKQEIQRSTEDAELLRELNDSENERLRSNRQQKSDTGFLLSLQKKQRQLITRAQQLLPGDDANSPASSFPTPSISMSDLSSRLPAESTLLVYSLTDEQSHLWSISQDSWQVFALPPRDRITRYANEALHWLTNRGTLSHKRKKPLQWLSQNLLAEVGPALSRRLLVVADGSLGTLPLHLLENPATGRPLYRDHEIVYLPSLAFSNTFGQLWGNEATNATPTKDLVAFGDPLYAQARLESKDPDLDTWSENLRPLYASREEVETISGLYPSRTSALYLGADASREAILGGALEGYRYVHLSMHAKANIRRPELSRVILSTRDANGGPIEGNLFLHEIDDLDLSCDLIVMSACSTAEGREIRGEGVISLARAALTAGARQAIVSLWGVDDEATSELMQQLHKSLRQGLSPSAALRSAQEVVRKTPVWEDPYFWAAFVVVGD